MTAAVAALASAELGRIKGAAFREFVAWYRSARGDAALSALADALPAHVRAQLDPRASYLGVIPSRWYDAEVVHALLDGATEGLSTSARHELARAAGRAIIGATLHGVYRFAFSVVASPRRMQVHAQTLWNLHYDSGISSVEPETPTCYVNTRRDWRAHHPTMCRMVTEASVVLFEAMGCEHTRLEYRACVSNGDDACVSALRWRK